MNVYSKGVSFRRVRANLEENYEASLDTLASAVFGETQDGKNATFSILTRTPSSVQLFLAS